MCANVRKVASGKWLVPGRRSRSLIADHCSLVSVSLLLLTLGTGCRMVQTAVEMPGEAVVP